MRPLVQGGVGMRRFVLSVSIALAAASSAAAADFSNWAFMTPDTAFALETAVASAGPLPSERCFAYGYLSPTTFAFSAEIRCGNQVANSIPTISDPSVAMDSAP